MTKLKKSLSVLLSLVMLFTTLCFFVLPETGIKANAAAGAGTAVSVDGDASAYNRVDDVIITVPETIYMTPSADKTTTGQYYVNNTIKDGAVTLDTERAADSGKLSIYAPGATSATFQVVDAKTGATVGEPKVTGEGTAIAFSNGYATKTDIKLESIATGLAAGQTATIQWNVTLTYADKTVTYRAFSTLYAPWYQPVGAAARAVGSHHNVYTSSILWVSGVHGYSDGSRANKYYVQTAKFLPMLGKLTSPSNNDPTTNWIQSDSNELSPTMSYNSISESGTNYHARANTIGPTANLTVDTSRYNNFNQIPNFTVGFMITDKENANESYKPLIGDRKYSTNEWYVSDYGTNDGSSYYSGTDRGGSQYTDDWNDNGGTKIWSGTSDLNCGIKVNSQPWDKAISGTADFRLKSAATGMNIATITSTSWNNNFVNISVTGVNKTELRKLVLQATSINRANYANYENYEKDFAHFDIDIAYAAYVLGNPTATADQVTEAINRLSASTNGGKHPVVADWTNCPGLQINVYARRNHNSSDNEEVDRKTVVIGTNTVYSYEPDVTPEARTGYDFVGWNADRNATTGNIPASVSLYDDDKSVYAIWAIKQYTMTFETGGGTAIAPITKNYGEQISAPANPTKTGHTFVKWNVSFPHTLTGDITATAEWSVNKYSITFDSKGGSSVGAITQDFGTDIILPADPTKAGYDFDGWTPALPKEMPANNLSVSAKWKPKNYTITYDLTADDVEGAVLGTSVPSYTIEDAVTLPSATSTNYDFIGWDVISVEDGNWEIRHYKAGENLTGVYGNVTLRAKWSIKQFTVTWKNWDGTVLETDTVSYGAKPSYDQASFPTRAKDAQYTYTFAGWDKNITSVTENITFTAQYTSTINSYTVTWLDFDRTVLLEESYEYGETPVYLGTPERIDSTGMYTYTFSGWSPEIGTVKGDTIYTAQYTREINTYKITFSYRDKDGVEHSVTLDSVKHGTPFSEIVPKDCVEYYNSTIEGFNHSHYKGVWNKEVDVITETADFVLTYTEEENVIMYIASDNAPATCETPGLDSRECHSCGYKYSEKIDALKHNWENKGNSAECLKPGKITQQCSRCQKTQEIDSPAKGHSFTTTTAAVAATCITDGSHAYKTCVNCGLFFAVNEDNMSENGKASVADFKIEAQGHQFTLTEAAAADCTNDGHKAYNTCSVCKLYFAEDADAMTATGTDDVTEFTITMLGHDHKSVVTDPTCTEDGFTTHTCSRCGDNYTDSTVEKTGHKPGAVVIENVQNASCTEEGSYDEVVYCTVKNCCKDIPEGKEYYQISRVTKNTYLPHNYVSYEVTEETASELCAAVKTCYSYGVYYKTCSMCGRSAELADDIEEKTFENIAGGKLPHTPGELETITTVTATCTVKAEWDEVKHCTVAACGAETERTHKVGDVDLTNHGTHTRTTSEINVVPGTCKDVRTWTEIVTCDGCHNKISETPRTGNKNALNHVGVKEGTPYVDTPGTCISETVWRVDTDCTACNAKKIKTRTYKGDKDPANHASEPVLTTENTVAATCVKEGSYQAVATCPDCHVELRRVNMTIPVNPANHVAETYLKNENVVAGTCTAEKTWDEVTYCSDCNNPVGEAVHKTGEKDPANHSGTTELRGYKEATCGAEGYTGDLYRTCCEVLEAKGEIIPMLAEHTPGEAVKENEIPATETTDGEFDSVVYCSVCETELSREHVIHKIERTIKFVLKDKTIEVKAFSGDTVEAPATPEVQTEDGFWHYFIGWDKKIKPVTGDATYTAIYTEPCDYTELERLEAQLKEIIADGSVDDETLEANKEEIEAVLAEIKKIYMDRNYRDVSEQNEITEVTDKVESLIHIICPDLGSTLVIEGSVVQYTGQILALRAVKMPSGTEVFDADWTSSDESIVFFANGKLYAIGTGTVTITAQRGTLTDSATITIVAGGNTRGINFTSVDNASFIIENAYQTKDGSIVFWSDDQPIRFRVHANAGFLYEKYYVYINGEAAETDMDGYYTIPANSGDVRITIAGEMIDTGAGEGPTVTKWSFWDWLLSFFKKIGDFFRGLFS